MFPLTRADIVQASGMDQCARRNRRARTVAMIVSAAAIALLASAPTFADPTESSSRTSLEHHACAVTLGLDPSEEPYGICISSLDRSLSQVDLAQRTESNRNACARMGLNPGTPDFARCVLKADQSATDAGR